jgi:hypothetical protein
MGGAPVGLVAAVVMHQHREGTRLRVYCPACLPACPPVFLSLSHIVLSIYLSDSDDSDSRYQSIVRPSQRQDGKDPLRRSLVGSQQAPSTPLDSRSQSHDQPTARAAFRLLRMLRMLLRRCRCCCCRRCCCCADRRRSVGGGRIRSRSCARSRWRCGSSHRSRSNLRARGGFCNAKRSQAATAGNRSRSEA